ncbi:MAG: ABC transporter ATP-binding protein [Actinomycetota bacterium]
MSELVLTSEPDGARALRRAWPLVREHRVSLVVAILTSIVVSVLRLVPPLMIGRAIDAIGDADRDALLTVAVVLVVAAVLLWVGTQMQTRAQAVAGERMLESVRNRVTAAMFGQPLRFFDRHEAGELTARATTDVQSLTAFVRTSGPGVVNAIVFLVIAAVVLATLSWRLTLTMLVYLPFLAVTLRRFRNSAPAAYAARAAAVADMTAIVSESIAARSTLAGIGVETTILERTHTADDELIDRADAALRADNLLSPLDFGKLAALAIVVVVGGLLATGDAGSAGSVSVGTVAAFAVAAGQLFDPIDQLTRQYGGIQQARSNVARILEMVPPSSTSVSAATPHRDGRRDHRVRRAGVAPGGLALSAEAVSFRYADDAPSAVDSVDLSVLAGQTVALVGETGSGKSTFATLLSGLRPSASGQVAIGGRRIEEWDPVELRHLVTVLPQRAHLIEGTVADNLRFVPGCHEDGALTEALRRVTSGRVVGDDVLTLDSMVEAGGTNLSAGERQLIALARIELIDPRVVVLDEATADIDPATERLVNEALATVFLDRTVIVIAHRPETAARCDRIVTMAAGRIVSDQMTDDGRASAVDDGP